MECKHAPVSLLLKQYPESILHNSDLLILIPFEIDLTSAPFGDKTILAYEIDLPISGKNVGFNLLNDEHFTIPYDVDTIPNSPSSHQFTTKAKKNCGSLPSMWKILSQLKARLMNSIDIKLHVENKRSRSVYAEGSATR